MKRAYYADSIKIFISSDADSILGKIVDGCTDSTIRDTQKNSWKYQIDLLKPILSTYEGLILFEYSIPRMGLRIDTVLIIGHVVFVIEFKIGQSHFTRADLDQVCDYALDLKHFHKTSHREYIAPLLVATSADNDDCSKVVTTDQDKLLRPICCNSENLVEIIDKVLGFKSGQRIDPEEWGKGSYCPTPTIIEAATALYKGHSVEEISRNDAGAINLRETTDTISEVIRTAKDCKQKAICFVTGVPGSGKTLVGLNIATKHLKQSDNTYSVFLSGNGPLVRVLQEALARDKVARENEAGKKTTKKKAKSDVKAFVQNVHHYRDEYLIDAEQPPADHVALFDEAQRAWNLKQTSTFMKIKKKIMGFEKSEPEFLISCIDRHKDWGVIVCLVGGGQEINTGEAGISEWIKALNDHFQHWHIYVSDRLTDNEYDAGRALKHLHGRENVFYRPKLHLAVSMRSFRAENVSSLVKHVLDLDADLAQAILQNLKAKYPIRLTRDIERAKEWVKSEARGTERYGVIVSSQAERLKPYAIDVRPKVDPIHWFLNDKSDVRASYYMEDVVTEFDIQGLELDWACVVWDADFRYSAKGWVHRSFRGSKWQKISKPERQDYLKNAYRVLLTRARQGMVIVVPRGDQADHTRVPSYYDPTFEYLRAIGFTVI